MLSELKAEDIYVGMKVISAIGKDGQICKIEDDVRGFGPMVYIKWDGVHHPSSWWLSGLKYVGIKQ